MDKPAPLIVTLALDEPTFAFFDVQRRRYFPPGRNLLAAHVTLFHHLPGQHEADIALALKETAAAGSSIPVAVTGLRSLGRGVAYALSSPELDRLHAALATRWATWLTPQDRQPFRPHVTIQNKVEPTAAAQLFEALRRSFTPFHAVGRGLELWHYRGGPWEAAGNFPFRPAD